MTMPPKRITWIDRSQWETMLKESSALYQRAEALRREGMRNDYVWAELSPLNQTIRSSLLMVRGIDDRRN